MLSWAITFLIIAIAKILFVVFLVMFVVSFIFGRRGRG